MIFFSRSQFASWFEDQIKEHASGSWIGPSECETIAVSILKKIDTDIRIPSAFNSNHRWESVYRYGEIIWEKNRELLQSIDIPVSIPKGYVSSSNNSSTYSSRNSSSTRTYNKILNPNSNNPSSSTSSYGSGSGVIKRHNFDSSLRKIQNFSNQVPQIPELDKFSTDGGLFGWGDHYINGYEMNRYVEKVQNLFRTHNDMIIKTIQEFRDVYSTFDYLDKEYLSGILQTATAASKASEGARTASNQAKVASEQAKDAADKALKNEADLKKDVENLRKLVEKIRTIKEDLSNKIENTNISFSRELRRIEKDFQARSLSNEQYDKLIAQSSEFGNLEKFVIEEIDNLSHKIEKHNNENESFRNRIDKIEKISEAASNHATRISSAHRNISNGNIAWAYVIAGLSLVCSIISFLVR